MQAAANYRVWMLAITYGASFGVEIFIHATAASYYVDRFGLTLESAGLAAGSFGLLALFARALGGIASDRVARTFGLDGRHVAAVPADGGRGPRAARLLDHGRRGPAIVAMLAFGLFTHMACGADLRAGAVHRPQGARRRGRASSARAATSAPWRPGSC